MKIISWTTKWSETIGCRYIWSNGSHVYVHFYHNSTEKGQSVPEGSSSKEDKHTTRHQFICCSYISRRRAPQEKREVVHIVSLGNPHFCLLFTKHTRMFVHTRRHPETSTSIPLSPPQTPPRCQLAPCNFLSAPARAKQSCYEINPYGTGWLLLRNLFVHFL